MPIDPAIALARRAMLVRWGALVMAGMSLSLILLAEWRPESLELSHARALVIGLPPLLLNAAVAWRTSRPIERARLRQLAVAQAVLAGMIAAVTLTAATERLAPALIALSLVYVYSGLVLSTQQHALVVAASILGAIAAGAATDMLGPRAIAPLLTMVGAGLLTGVGARLHTTELLERDRAVRRAQRAERALNAAVVGIQAAATTETDRILQAVTAAAGRLVDGPSSLWLAGEDGLLRAGAAHRMPPQLTARAMRPDEGMVGQVLRAGQTIVLRSEDSEQLGTNHRTLGLRSAIGTPIIVDGVVDGALLAGRVHGNDWTSEEIAAYALLAEHAGRALELARKSDADRLQMARLAELDRIKDDVVATVSHELRTPVTVISGLAETLATHPELPEDVRDDALRRLWSNAVTLGRIVEQLLDTALLDRGELVPTIRAIPMRRLVDAIIERLMPLLARHDIQVQVQDDCVVLADGSLLERVLENLLVNAVNHTPTGTQVRVSAATRGTEVMVAAEDDGPGIDPAEVPRVLERFGRGGRLNERGRGLGLGLALAQDILAAHGSSLEVITASGAGARFAFCLPSAHVAPISATVAGSAGGPPHDPATDPFGRLQVQEVADPGDDVDA